jgi:hypothetical protein
MPFGDMTLPTPPVLTGPLTMDMTQALSVLSSQIGSEDQAMQAQAASQGFLTPQSIMAWISTHVTGVYVLAGLMVGVIYLLPPGRRHR